LADCHGRHNGDQRPRVPADGVDGRRADQSRLQLPEPELLQLIAALRKNQAWVEASDCMLDYLRMYRERAAMVRLALAQIFVEKLNRPSQALRTIGKIDDRQLDDAKRKLLATLQSKATAAAEEYPYEAVTDEC